MSTLSAQKKIRQIRQRQAAAIEGLLASPPMLRGALVRVSTRCGKPTCWCAAGPEGHEHTRLSWSQDGRRTTRKVPLEERQRVRTLTLDYRRFRHLRRKLVRLQRELHDAVVAFEAALIEQTRRPLAYLAIAQNPTPKPAPPMRKARNTAKHEDTQS